MEVVKRIKKEVTMMKKGTNCLALGVALIAIGTFYLAKKTGFFEDDAHLYDAFDSTR